MQLKFINQSKIFIVNFACFIFCIIYHPTNIVICTICLDNLLFTRYLILHQPNYKLYMFRGCARILVRGDIRQNFIHKFLSSPVLMWRHQNFTSRGAFSKNVLIKDFRKISKKFIKKILQKFIKFSKIFQ